MTHQSRFREGFGLSLSFDQVVVDSNMMMSIDVGNIVGRDELDDGYKYWW